MNKTVKSRYSKKRKSAPITLTEDELKELRKEVEQVILDSIIILVTIKKQIEKK